jgi:hypothetical protein
LYDDDVTVHGVLIHCEARERQLQAAVEQLRFAHTVAATVLIRRQKGKIFRVIYRGSK